MKLALVLCPECLKHRFISSVAALQLADASEEHTVKCDIHGEVEAKVILILPMPHE